MKVNSMARSMLAAQLVLLVPLVAMLFSNEMDWSAADFLVAGILLAGLGSATHLLITGIKNSFRQSVLGLVIAAAMVLIWIELAVGLFGSPFAGS